jgi:hypothetical protein
VEQLLQALATPPDPEAPVDGDAGEPGFDGGRVTKLPDPCPSRDVGVLDHVLCPVHADERCGDSEEPWTRRSERRIKVDVGAARDLDESRFDRLHLPHLTAATSPAAARL